jgi:hypothetical protein
MAKFGSERRNSLEQWEQEEDRTGTIMTLHWL